MRGVSYPTFRYLRVLSERRRLAIKRIFWITSAIWFYLIYQNWTPPLDCEVASLTWWIIYTFVGAAIILTLTVWKWEIKFAAKAWYRRQVEHVEFVDPGRHDQMRRLQHRFGRRRVLDQVSQVKRNEGENLVASGGHIQATQPIAQNDLGSIAHFGAL